MFVRQRDDESEGRNQHQESEGTIKQRDIKDSILQISVVLESLAWCVCSSIDLSSDHDMPLVVSEIQPRDTAVYGSRGELITYLGQVEKTNLPGITGK